MREGPQGLPIMNAKTRVTSGPRPPGYELEGAAVSRQSLALTRGALNAATFPYLANTRSATVASPSVSNATSLASPL